MISAYRDVVRKIDLTKKSGSVQWTPPDWEAKIVFDDISRVGWRRSHESQRHEKQVGAEPARWNRSGRVGGPLGDFPDRSDAWRVGTWWSNTEAGGDHRSTRTGRPPFRLPHDRRQGAVPVFRASRGRAPLRDRSQ